MPPRWDWFTAFYLKAGSPLLHFCFFISWASNLAQLQGTLLMTLNRFSALVYTKKHDLIWRNKTFYLLAFILLPSFLLGCATLYSSVEYKIVGQELTQRLVK
jgi:hypothetical protein